MVILPDHELDEKEAAILNALFDEKKVVLLKRTNAKQSEVTEAKISYYDLEYSLKDNTVFEHPDAYEVDVSAVESLINNRCLDVIDSMELENGNLLYESRQTTAIGEVMRVKSIIIKQLK